jgi:hypothetical protein
MNVRIHILSKIGVTGVTHVTTATKRPNSLTFRLVTRLRGLSYTRCNSAQTCNAKTSPRPPAGRRLPRADKGFRWLRSQNIGRGIETHKTHETLTDD